jgi:radical SAM superfamily enzyme YgiQ (UPF0313 family)
MKDPAIIEKDILFAARHCGRQRRVFLADGDPLIMPQSRLLPLLRSIRTHLPRVTRVGIYGNAKSIRSKSDEQLRALREHGLGIVYMGVETGDDVTLRRIRKGVRADTMVEMGQRIIAAGMKLSVTVLLGIAGSDRSRIHAESTGKALSRMDPDYVGALSLMLLPNTPLARDYQEGHFDLIGPTEMIRELQTMMYHTDLSSGLFHANHASNYVPIKARFPRDKAATIALLDKALSGELALTPEFMRAL